MSAKKTQLRLVIDTNIARSASETSHPTSVNCRKALEAIRDLGFRLVFTPDLMEEYKKHRSRFFNRWLIEMFARKLQLQLDDAKVQNSQLRADISKFALQQEDKAKAEKDEREMLKDVLLLEAALVTDKTVISMNDVDKQRFQAICEFISMIRELVWVNPDNEADECLTWLREGAPADEFRMLGYQEET